MSDPTDSVAVNQLYSEATSALSRGNVSVAEEKLKHLVRLNGNNAEYLYKLGEVYQEKGKLRKAVEAFEKSSSILGHSETTRMKKLATLNDWMRNYNAARGWLDKELQLQPEDAEAQDGLADIRRRRSVHLFGSLGGWEVDYAKNVRDIGAFVGWIDWLDLYGSYSTSDRIFYEKNSLSLDAYIFPSYDLYLRLGLRDRRYSYPQAGTISPDNNAYDRVPAIQLEMGYSYATDNTVSLEVEYFRPDFYWNRNLRAENVKLAVNVKNWIVRPVYIKLFGAILKDPDPASFTMDGATGNVRSFEYEQVGLAGGGLGFDNGRLSAEIKYVPDRDLDRSTAWSTFTRVRYSWEDFGIQYDMLHDRYMPGSAGTVPVSNVHMITVLLHPFNMFEVRAGAKMLTKDITEVVPFLYLRYMTGL